MPCIMLSLSSPSVVSMMMPVGNESDAADQASTGLEAMRDCA